MKEQLIKRFGEHRVSEIPVKDGEIPLLMLDLELRSPVTVIVTNGLSDYDMPVHEKWKGREHNELYFCLPSYWLWEETDNPKMNWPLYWLQRLSKFVVEKETWFGHGHTMPCGSEATALSESMLQSYFLLTDPILLEMEMAPIMVGEKEVNFLAIVPLFKDEFNFKQSKGMFKFRQKLVNNTISEKLDDFRKSCMKRRWKMRD